MRPSSRMDYEKARPIRIDDGAQGPCDESPDTLRLFQANEPIFLAIMKGIMPIPLFPDGDFLSRLGDRRAQAKSKAEIGIEKMDQEIID